MTDHLRFKRHIRFLQDGDVVRVVTDLDGGTVVPAGDAFDHLLAAIGAAWVRGRRGGLVDPDRPAPAGPRRDPAPGI